MIENCKSHAILSHANVYSKYHRKIKCKNEHLFKILFFLIIIQPQIQKLHRSILYFRRINIYFTKECLGSTEKYLFTNKFYFHLMRVEFFKMLNKHHQK